MSKKRRILVYESRQSGEIPFAFAHAFESMGFEVAVYNGLERNYLASTLPLIRGVERRVKSRHRVASHNRELRQILLSRSFDLFLVFRGDTISPDTIQLARSLGTRTAYFNTDDLLNQLNSNRRILASLPLYDRVFSPRPHLESEYLRLGARAFEEIDWYYRPGLVDEHIAPGEEGYLYEVAFIGSFSKHRERILTKLKDFDLHVWGWGWRQKSSKKFRVTATCHEPLDMVKMMKTFNKTKININLLTHENRDISNLRVFEVLAAAGFLLSESSSRIADLFEPGSEIETFLDPDEMVDKCEKYLVDNLSRETIALAGHNALLARGHSVYHRAKAILDAFSISSSIP